MSQNRVLAQALLIGLGFLALLLGLITGLRRLGWGVPQPHPSLFLMHGALMVGGFLGTLISMERAVAVRRFWAYLAPIGSAVTVPLLLLNQPRVALLSLCVGSMVLIAIYGMLWRNHRVPFTLLMGIGAVCWLIGNCLWSLDAGRLSPLAYNGVYCWIAFVLLTIVGERMELNRLFRWTFAVRWWLWTGVSAVIAGLLLLLAGIDEGARLLDGGVLVATLWLLRYDLARYTIRQRGLTRFIGWSLLSGYLWLGVSSVIGLLSGKLQGGALYDAMLHAFFVGFTFAMIFGHAPVIFPAVLGIPIPYRPRFYGHLVLMHLSLLMRLVGDLMDWLLLRQWGGLLNAAAILLFIVNTLVAAFQGILMSQTAYRR